MAEQANGTAAASTPAQSAGQAQPSAQSTGELEALRSQVQSLTSERDRYKQQADGSRAYYEAGNKVGLKDAKAFDRLAPLLAAESSGKVRLDQLAAALAEADKAGADPTDMKSMLDQYVKEHGFVSRDEIQKMDRIREARSKHSELAKAETEAMKELMVKLLPDEADDWDKMVMEGFLSGHLMQHRQLYPKGHALYHEDHQFDEIASPLDRAALEKHLTTLMEKRDGIRGAKAAAKGDAYNASRGKSPTVAGAAAATPTKPENSRARNEADEIREAEAIIGRAAARRKAAV